MRALPSRLAWIVVVVAVVVAACDHQERVRDNPAAAAWTEMSTRMNGQIASLRSRQRALADAIGKLAVPTGTEDVTLTAAIGELQGSAGALDAAIGQVEGVVKQASADVTIALGQPDKRGAERAVKAAQAPFDTATANAQALLAGLEPKVGAAQTIMERLAAGIEAEITQLRRLAAAGGNVDFSAIDFKAGSADFDFTRPASKATLDRLVQFAATCPQLRFGITGHTSKEGVAARNKELSLQRAEAVKAYLLAQGVEADKIARTAGLGSTKTLADEPDPDSPAAIAMDAAALENLRRVNRRVNIDVVTSCVTPVEAPAASGAQTVPRPIAPPH